MRRAGGHVLGTPAGRDVGRPRPHGAAPRRLARHRELLAQDVVPIGTTSSGSLTPGTSTRATARLAGAVEHRAVERHRAGVGPQPAGEDQRQGGVAVAGLADDRADLAGVELDVGGREHRPRAAADGDAGRAEHVLGHGATLRRRRSLSVHLRLGTWPGSGAYVSSGEFKRDSTTSPTGSPGTGAAPEHGPVDGELWPVEPGRYRLVAAKACPWATRAIIVRQLLGLEDVISLGTPGPVHDERSWTFDLDPGGVDPVLGIERSSRPTSRASPTTRAASRCRRSSTPSGGVVTNDFPWITHDFFFEWRELHRADAPDLWPADLREEMEEVMQRVYTEVNNGVYRCGFASSQEAYDAAYDRLWAALDWLEERLATRRYLMGDALTEADVRLWTTLARFDAVYHGHFKCNRQKLTEMPNLWGYARELYAMPAFGDNTDFEQIKTHYYVVHQDLNPTQIVPKGPDPAVWLEPHGRG